MRLYRVTLKEWIWDEKEQDGHWGVEKEKYVIALAAREVTKKYEERDDTQFMRVELITDNVEEIDPQ